MKVQEVAPPADADGRWATDVLPPGQQYAYWRDVICHTYTPLRPVHRDTSRDTWAHDGLAGVVEARSLGHVKATRIRSNAQRIHHGRRELARTSDEVVCVNLQVAGRCVGRQGDRTSISGPGTVALFDASREFHLDYVDDWTTISFRVPREQLLPLVPDLDRATSVLLHPHPGTGTLLTGMMRDLWRESPHLDADGSATLGQSFVFVLASAMRTAASLGEEGQAARDTALRAAITAHLAQNLNGVAVTPAAVAARFGVSTRKLHALFESTELTFGQTLLRLRVDACRRELRSASAPHSLTDLASRMGFSDLSHMHRVFRAQVGCSPAEYRSALPAGSATGAAHAGR